MIQKCTLRMSNVWGLGPLEEKEATKGADVSLIALLLKIVAVGALSITRSIKGNIKAYMI